MRGLLQDEPLTLRCLFERLERQFAGRTVATARGGQVVRRRSYADLARRARRIAAALDAAGVEPGERVATLAFNSDDHLELMLGICAAGRVFHALNPRLPREELDWIVHHAGDAMLFVDRELLAHWNALPPPACVREVVVIESPDESPDRGLRDYQAFLDAAGDHDAWSGLDERDAAALCYTSGTTGAPKGVLYSHRGLVLVSLAWMSADAAAMSQADCFMPAVPLFHAQAWALPFSALLAGSAMVLTGADVSPASLAKLIETESVTLASGVPTIWRGLADAVDEGLVRPQQLASLERIVCGGSAVPGALLQAYDDLDVRLIQVWGMTEMSPLGTVSRVRSEIPPDAALAERARQGQVQPLVSLRVVDEAGAELPWDAESAGEVQASGPWIADAYFDNEAPSGRLDSDAFVTDAAGRRWLRTGDVGHISPLGQLELVDRAKDLIKSGGEWISSVRLEQIIDNHPAVAASAVIAIPDPKWDERPLAIVELKPGAEADPASVLELLRGAVASWQVPDEVRFVDRLPRNSLGKLDKQALRERFVPPHPDNE